MNKSKVIEELMKLRYFSNKKVTENDYDAETVIKDRKLFADWLENSNASKIGITIAMDTWESAAEYGGKLNPASVMKRLLNTDGIESVTFVDTYDLGQFEDAVDEDDNPRNFTWTNGVYLNIDGDDDGLMFYAKKLE
jgi:hypothetical protein